MPTQAWSMAPKIFRMVPFLCGAVLSKREKEPEAFDVEHNPLEKMLSSCPAIDPPRASVHNRRHAV